MTVQELFLTTLNSLFLINIIFAIIVILFEKRKPTVTMSWLLIMLFMPIIGFILYIFLGQDLRKKKLFYIKSDEEKTIYAAIKKQDDCMDKNLFNFKNPLVAEHKDMISLNLNSRSLFTQDNSLEIFNDGKELFDSMIARIKEARVFIHMEYYIIRDDQLGNEIIKILAEKARSGIEVKLLYDGMGCLHVGKKFFQPLIDAGGEVEMFFPPFLPYINLRINYRNHRKITVIDGLYGYVGGFNIGDEYLGKNKKIGYWRDSHLCIAGTAIQQLELRFLLDWRHASGLKEEFKFDLRYFPQQKFNGNIAVQIVSSGPDSKWSSIRNAYLKIINKAHKTLYLHTPYFIPDDSIFVAIKLAALSGVDVRIIIPHKSDHMFVHWAASSYIGELLEAHVKVYHYNNGFLHSKMIVADSFISTIGTANLDIRSFQLNFEVNALMYDRQIGKLLEEQFLKDLESCTEMTLDTYNKRHITIKIRESIFRLLSPLL